MIVGRNKVLRSSGSPSHPCRNCAEYRLFRPSKVTMKLVMTWCCLAANLIAAEPNTWVEYPNAKIEGRRYETPLGYSPDLKKFIVLGGRTSSAEYRKPRSFDQLALDMDSGMWENLLPAAGLEWGTTFGPFIAPPWKNE
jgi:hypothetical protein